MEKTDIYLHPASLLCLLYSALAGSWGMFAAAYGSIILHECSHAAAAVMLGQAPAEIELTPMGAIMRLEDEARLTVGRRLLMLAAGPAVSFGLCAAAFAMTEKGWLAPAAGRLIFLSNLAIVLVNLLPVLPLDGGRMLSLILGLAINPARVCSFMRGLGRVAGAVSIGAGIWQTWHMGQCNFTLIAFGCFMLYSSVISTTTQAVAELQSFLERRIRLERRTAMKCRWIAALSTCPVRELLRRLPQESVCMIRVLECGSFRLLGDIDEFRLMEAYMRQPQGTMRDAVMNT